MPSHLYLIWYQCLSHLMTRRRTSLAVSVVETNELCVTRLLSVLIAAIPACATPDRLFTFIPRRDNDTNPCKWLPGRKEAGGTRPFKPISRPSIKLVICVGQKSLWHCHFSGLCFALTHTHTHTPCFSSAPQSSGDSKSHWLVELFAPQTDQ